MQKNIFSILAGVFSFIALIIGIFKLFPHFQKGAPDQTWIFLIITVCPLMTLIYAIAGTDDSIKFVSPNAFGLVLTFPCIIASFYLHLWVSVICMLLVAIFALKQLFQDSNESNNNTHHH
ncbi:hypothetical protein [Fluviispira multicolorata]|uniref:Uncharacterized protein n=1 Tax=Fluviispira multicolorata TaxID=2654512 RepID=A0A833N6N1_9BACT|nr:hypothetical protein [Fluviispira multicolorata]KAB8033700.1 hypothetical protein GCL57_03055 [Fluviispira multicolorata]